ncbi:MAG TPA: hypothetical protein VFX76_02785, partial [Roseiflexaceae bacterium]|nr:hypothetical protein [Roseiflexaceae bacterium]
FDGDRKTLIRGQDANPFVLEITFPEARSISGISLDYWRVELGLTITVTPDDGGQPQTFSGEYRNPPIDPHVDFNFPNGPIRARKLKIELLDLISGDVAKIHVPGLQIHP